VDPQGHSVAPTTNLREHVSTLCRHSLDLNLLQDA
jgi:hypothetical protein